MKVENVNCNYCTSSDYEILFGFGEMNIVRCRKCGLRYTNPRVAQDEVAEIYGETYYRGRESLFKEKGKYYGYYDYHLSYPDIVRTFEKRLEIIERCGKKGKLLDIGCALGFFVETSLRRGWDARGIEVSRYAADYARTKLGLNVETKNLGEAGFASGEFDAVTFWDVLEHTPDPVGILAESNRLLKKGGLIAFSVPDAGRLAVSLLGKHWAEYKRIKEHNYFFDRGMIAKMLTKTGFDILRMESIGRFFTVPSILNELKLYNYPLFSFLARCAERAGLNHLRFYIKPGYKVGVYARKK